MHTISRCTGNGFTSALDKNLCHLCTDSGIHCNHKSSMNSKCLSNIFNNRFIDYLQKTLHKTQKRITGPNIGQTLTILTTIRGQTTRDETTRRLEPTSSLRWPLMAWQSTATDRPNTCWDVNKVIDSYCESQSHSDKHTIRRKTRETQINISWDKTLAKISKNICLVYTFRYFLVENYIQKSCFPKKRLEVSKIQWKGWVERLAVQSWVSRSRRRSRLRADHRSPGDWTWHVWRTSKWAVGRGLLADGLS